MKNSFYLSIFFCFLLACNNSKPKPSVIATAIAQVDNNPGECATDNNSSIVAYTTKNDDKNYIAYQVVSSNNREKPDTIGTFFCCISFEESSLSRLPFARLI